jgi:arylsulfatase A-like enzyme
VIVAEAVSAVLLVAAMDVWLVQWTSHAVPLSTLAIDFAASGAVLAIVVLPVLAAFAVVRRRAPSRAFYTSILLALVVYDLSRIRTEKLSWVDPTSLLWTAILAIGCWNLLRPAAKRSAAVVADAIVAPLMVAATAATFVVLHVRSFTPTIGVLSLLGSATALQVASGRWLLSREGSAARQSIITALTSLAIAIGFSIASYPIVPGAPKLELRRGDGTVAVPRALPNVIVIVMDTVRADHLSLYGYEHPTSPLLARFARRAHVFRRAIANSSWSLPSHATLLTGLLPHQHGAHTVVASIQSRRDLGGASFGRIAHQPLPPGEKTVADRLSELGYETGLVAANHAWLSDDWGLARGFRYVENQPRTLVALDPFCGAYLRHQPFDALAALYERSTRSDLAADEVVDLAVDFLGRQHGRRFFLFLNFMDGHSPYASAARADAVPEIRERFSGSHASEANRDAYDRSIAFLDHQLGRLFAELESRGLFENSLIVVTSDHGERFGASGPGWHGDDLSQSTLHIPLLIKMPRQTEAEIVERLAQLADVAPTILETTGQSIPGEFFGSPLGRRSRAVIAENYLSAGGFAGALPTHGPARFVAMETIDEELPTQWALFSGRWKLLRDARGRNLLYDLADDPDESTDLASRRPEIVHEMTERLAALLPAGAFTGHRAPVAQPDLSPLAIEKLRSLGYTQ